jgi:hypothetical protein
MCATRPDLIWMPWLCCSGQAKLPAICQYLPSDNAVSKPSPRQTWQLHNGRPLQDSIELNNPRPTHTTAIPSLAAPEQDMPTSMLPGY